MSETQKKTYSMITKVTCLVVALLIYTNSVTTPGLAMISAAFPDVSPTLVKMIGTIPSLMMCLFSLVTGWLTTKLSLKKCIVIASGLITLGAIPAFFGDIYVVLISRFFFGAGYGMIMVLASAIITDLFDGSLKTMLMGWKTAVGAIAGIVFPMLGGALAGISWRYAFLGMLLTIPVVVLVLLFLPDTGVQEKKAQSEGKFKPSLFILMAVGFVMNILFFTFMVDMSFVVAQEGLGTAADAGSVLSMFSAFTVISGFVYSFASKLLKNAMPAVAALLMGLGIMVALYAPSLGMLYVAAAIFGVGFGFMNPAFTLVAASSTTHPSKSPMAISLYVCSTGIGQFVSPYVMKFLTGAFGLDAVRCDWQIAAYAITGGALIGLVVSLLAKKKSV